MEPGNPPQIGRNIQKIRKKHGMTLDILSEKSGVSKAMLSQIESEKVNPTIATVWKIAQGLDVDISSLLTGQDELLRKFQVSRGKRNYQARYRRRRGPYQSALPHHHG